MGKCKTTVMENLKLDWNQTDTTTETELSMLLNKYGKDKQAAEEDSEVRLRAAAKNRRLCSFS